MCRLSQLVQLHHLATASHRLALSHFLFLPSHPAIVAAASHYSTLDRWRKCVSGRAADRGSAAAMLKVYIKAVQAGRWEHALCASHIYITCLVPVISTSGYSVDHHDIHDIAISSWTLSLYRDPQKVHDSSPNLLNSDTLKDNFPSK